jgi:hypothetical protein
MFKVLVCTHLVDCHQFSLELLKDQLPELWTRYCQAYAFVQLTVGSQIPKNCNSPVIADIHDNSQLITWLF